MFLQQSCELGHVLLVSQSLQGLIESYKRLAAQALAQRDVITRLEIVQALALRLDKCRYGLMYRAATWTSAIVETRITALGEIVPKCVGCEVARQ